MKMRIGRCCCFCDWSRYETFSMDSILSTDEHKSVNLHSEAHLALRNERRNDCNGNKEEFAYYGGGGMKLGTSEFKKRFSVAFPELQSFASTFVVHPTYKPPLIYSIYHLHNTDSAWWILTWVTRSSACVRRSSAIVLSARSWTRSSSCDVVRVLRPNVVCGQNREHQGMK